MSTLHCALENGAHLYVNECQKIRHYRARSTEERRRIRRRRKKKRFYIHSFDWKSQWWCLKCVILYLARDIPAFVMYCIYEASRSSLLIESTNSVIHA